MTLAAKIVEFIQSTLDERGMSHKDLADLTGLHRPQITNYLSGKNSPGLDKVELILTKLNVRLEDAFGLEKRKKEINNKREFAISQTSKTRGKRLETKQPPSFAEGVKFLELYENLPPERKAVVAMLVYDDESYLDGAPELAHDVAGILKG